MWQFIGYPQNAAILHLGLWDARVKHLTIIQRLAGLTFGVGRLVQALHPFKSVLIPVVLLSASLVMGRNNKAQLCLLIRSACL